MGKSLEELQKIADNVNSGKVTESHQDFSDYYENQKEAQSRSSSSTTQNSQRRFVWSSAANPAEFDGGLAKVMMNTGNAPAQMYADYYQGQGYNVDTGYDAVRSLAADIYSDQTPAVNQFLWNSAEDNPFTVRPKSKTAIVDSNTKTYYDLSKSLDKYGAEGVKNILDTAKTDFLDRKYVEYLNQYGYTPVYGQELRRELLRDHLGLASADRDGNKIYYDLGTLAKEFGSVEEAQKYVQYAAINEVNRMNAEYGTNIKYDTDVDILRNNIASALRQLTEKYENEGNPTSEAGLQILKQSWRNDPEVLAEIDKKFSDYNQQKEWLSNLENIYENKKYETYTVKDFDNDISYLDNKIKELREDRGLPDNALGDAASVAELGAAKLADWAISLAGLNENAGVYDTIRNREEQLGYFERERAKLQERRDALVAENFLGRLSRNTYASNIFGQIYDIDTSKNAKRSAAFAAGVLENIGGSANRSAGENLLKDSERDQEERSKLVEQLKKMGFSDDDIQIYSDYRNALLSREITDDITKALQDGGLGTKAAAHLGARLEGAVSGIIGTLDNLINGSTGATAGQVLNTYSEAVDNYFISGFEKNHNETIAKAETWLYNTFNSAEESTINRLLFGGVGSAFMGLNSAVETYNEAINKGLDGKRAVTLAGIAGLAEWGTEQIAWGKIGLEGGDSIGKALFDAFVTEGAEESISKTITDAADYLFAGSLSDIKLMLADGMTPEQIAMKLVGENISETLAGGLSGFGSLGAKAARGYTSTGIAKQASKAAESVGDKVEKGVIGSAVRKTGNIDELLNKASTSENVTAYRQAYELKQQQAKTEDAKTALGRKISEVKEQYKAGKLYKTVSESNIKEKVNARVNEIVPAGSKTDAKVLSSATEKIIEGKMLSKEEEAAIRTDEGAKIVDELQNNETWVQEIRKENREMQKDTGIQEAKIEKAMNLPVGTFNERAKLDEATKKKQTEIDKAVASGESESLVNQKYEGRMGKTAVELGGIKSVSTNGMEVVVDQKTGATAIYSDVNGKDTVRATDSEVNLVYDTAEMEIRGLLKGDTLKAFGSNLQVNTGVRMSINAANVQISMFNSNANSDAATYMALTYEAYKAGKLGMSWSDYIERHTSADIQDAVTEEQLHQMFRAGAKDFEAKPGLTRIGTKTLSKQQADELAAIGSYFESIGRSVVVLDDLQDKNAIYSGKTGVIYLSLESEGDLITVSAFHELFHSTVDTLGKEEGAKLVDSVLDIVRAAGYGAELDAAIEQRGEMYDDLLVKEEVAAQFFGTIASMNPQTLAGQMAQDITFWNKIKDRFLEIIQGIMDRLKAFANDDKTVKLAIESARETSQKVLDVMQQALDIANNAPERVLDRAGYEVDDDTQTVFSRKFSAADENAANVDRDQIISSIMEITNRSEEEVKRFLAAEEAAALQVKGTSLDYIGNDKETAIKKNSDYPQGTIDLTNICPKRVALTNLTNRLQNALRHDLFTADDYADIRLILMHNGSVVACGLCYVEDRRQRLGEIADEFINEWNTALREGKELYRNNSTGQRKKVSIGKKLAKRYGVQSGSITPSAFNMDQSTFINTDGWKKLQADNPQIAAAFEAFNNARGMSSGRMLLDRAEYKREILKWNDKKVKRVNDAGGLRIYSFSDFETVHLVDILQIIEDCASRGVKIQGYTKQPKFAKLVSKMGLKLNRSFIPYGSTGLKTVNGRRVLAYDTIEGMDMNDPDFIDETDNPNVGNNITGINDEQIKVAMRDGFIHYIIPFHTGKAEDVNRKLGVAEWTNYKLYQTEKSADSADQIRALALAAKEYRNQGLSETDAYAKALLDLNKSGVKFGNVKEVDNVNIYTTVLSDPNVTDVISFTEKFLQVCRERNLVPRFAQFLDINEDGDFVFTEGYYKMLVDFKLFDGDGNLLPQGYVNAVMDEDTAQFVRDMIAEEVENDTTETYPEELYEGILNYIKVKHGRRGNMSLYNEYAGIVEDQEERSNRDENGTGNYAIRESKKITAEQDEEYMQAVKSGDMETAQRMVDETGVNAGAMTLLNGARKYYYHNTNAEFTSFDIEKARDGTYGYGFYFSPMQSKANDYGKRSIKAFVMTDKIATRNDHKITADDVDKFVESAGIDLSDTVLKYADSIEDWVSYKDDLSIIRDLERWATERTAIGPNEMLSSLRSIFGYDGIRQGNETVVWDNRLIKSADPVTYDDNGNVIPLSERFNPKNEDIRYSTKITQNMPIKEQVDAVESRSLPRYESLYFGYSRRLANVGFADVPYIMNQSDFRKSRREKKQNTKRSAHNINKEVFYKLISLLDDAVIFVDNGEKVTIITDEITVDRSGNLSLVVVGVWRNQVVENKPHNLIKSVYPFDDLEIKLQHFADIGKMVITNKNKAQNILSEVGIDTAKRSNILNLAKDSISQDSDKSNIKSKKISSDQEEDLVQSASMTLERIDDLINDSGAGMRKDYARAWITSINPSEFLKMTLSSELQDREKFDNYPGDYGTTVNEYDFIEGLKTNKRQTPYLAIDADTGAVVGHEGRHRLRALEKLGVTSVDIQIEFRDENGYIIKEKNGYGNPLETIDALTIYNQRGTGQSTVIRNIIPLNKANRENVIQSYGNPDADIRYSRKLITTQDRLAELGEQNEILDQSLREARKELRNLKAALAKAQMQMTETNGTIPKNGIIQNIVSKYNHEEFSGMKNSEVTDTLFNVFKNLDKQEVGGSDDLINTVIDIMYQNARGAVETYESEELDMIREYTKGNKYYIGDSEFRQLSENAGGRGHLNDALKSTFGFTLMPESEAEGKDVSHWGSTGQEIADSIPYVFNGTDYADNAREGASYETAAALHQLAASGALSPVTLTAYGTEEDAYNAAKVDALEMVSELLKASTIRTLADKYVDKIDELREKYLANDKKKQAEIERLRKEKSAIIGAKNDKLAATRQYYINRQHEQVVNRQNKKVRDSSIKSISKTVKWINERFTRETDDKNIPEVLKKVVAPFMQIFLDEEKTDAGSTTVFNYKQIDRLMQFYSKFSDDIDSDEIDPRVKDFIGMYDQDVYNALSNLKETLDGKRLRELTLTELDDIKKVMLNLKHIIQNYNTAFVNGKRIDMAFAGESLISDMGDTKLSIVRKLQTLPLIKRPFTAADDFLGTKMLKPIYFFKEKIGGTLGRFYDDIREGQNRWYFRVEQSRQKFEDIKKKYHYKDWATKGATFNLADGTQISLDMEAMMQLYATYQRERALGQTDHIFRGGIVLGEELAENQRKYNKKFEKVKDIEKNDNERRRGAEDFAKNNRHYLTGDDLSAIFGKLFETPDAVRYAKEVVRFLSDTVSEWGNETSMELFGIKKYTESYYFPFQSADNFLFTRFGVQEEARMKHRGFTNRIQNHANNPLVISSLTDVAASHASEMASYSTMTVPIENMQRLFNYKNDDTNVKQAISSVYGKYSLDYIKTFMEQINGGVRSDRVDALFNKASSAFKRSAVMLNLSVAIQQPSAIARAMAMVNPVYFAESTFHYGEYKELMKYSGIAGIKKLGGFDTNTGVSTISYITGKQTASDWISEKTGMLAEKADEITWSQIWHAVKRETAHEMGIKYHNKGMPEEFYQAAAKRFNDVVDYTQVYDSVLSKNELMRSSGGLAKMVTAFMAEPATSFNLITMSGMKRNGKTINKAAAIFSFVAATVLNEALQSVVGAWRDKDEDETYLEKYIESFVGSLTGDPAAFFLDSSLSPVTMIPWVKDMLSLIEGYDVERSDVTVASDIIKVLQKAIELLRSEDEVSPEDIKDILIDIGVAITEFTPVPLKSMKKDIEGIARVIDTAKNKDFKTTVGTIMKQISELFYVDDVTKADELYQAIIHGDKETIRRITSLTEDDILKEMEGNDFTREQAETLAQSKKDKEYDNLLKKALANNDARVQEAAQMRIDKDLYGYEDIVNEMIREGLFGRDTIVNAINDAYDNLLPEEYSAPSASKVESMYTVEEYIYALSTGATDIAENAKDDYLATAIKNGKTMEKAEEAFEKKVKETSLDMYNNGELTQDQVVDSMVDAGIDKDKADINFGWEEFQNKYPDKYEHFTSASYNSYVDKGLEAQGVPVEVFANYKEDSYGIHSIDSDGDGKTDIAAKSQKMDIINSYDISYEAKDALYYYEGWAASKIDEAPWH